VPNNIVLGAAVVPLREPASVDLRARLRPDVRPSDVQSLLQEAIDTPVRGEPTIALEEVDADEVVVRIQATPLADSDGPQLADQVLAAIAAVTQEGSDSHGDDDVDDDERDDDTPERVAARTGGGPAPGGDSTRADGGA
jgi:hypothetical protein